MAAEAAPYLHQYFEVVKRVTSEIMEGDNMLALMADPEGAQAKMQETQVALKAEILPLIEQSFKHHDTKGNNVLDKDEAAVFFSHIVAEESAFIESVAAMAIRASIKMVMAMMGDMLKELPEDKKKEVTDQLQSQIADATAKIHEQVEAMSTDYKANKAERDAAAFAICDTNGDGTLELAEIVAILTPEDPKNDAFQKALGFEPKMPEGQEGCPQQ